MVAKNSLSQQDVDLLLKASKLAINYISEIGRFLRAAPQVEMRGNIIIQALVAGITRVEANRE